MSEIVRDSLKDHPLAKETNARMVTCTWRERRRKRRVGEEDAGQNLLREGEIMTLCSKSVNKEVHERERERERE